MCVFCSVKSGFSAGTDQKGAVLVRQTRLLRYTEPCRGLFGKLAYLSKPNDVVDTMKQMDPHKVVNILRKKEMKTEALAMQIRGCLAEHKNETRPVSLGCLL